MTTKIATCAFVLLLLAALRGQAQTPKLLSVNLNGANTMTLKINIPADRDEFTLTSAAVAKSDAIAALANARPLTGRAAGTGDPLTLWYDAPAADWEQALPVGNGRLGAMIFGGVDHELLQLNDITVWSGGPELTADRPEAYKHLPEIRAAIRAGDHRKADQLSRNR